MQRHKRLHISSKRVRPRSFAVAEILGSSDLTLRNQLHRRFRKLSAANRVEAIRPADELSLFARQKL